MIDRIELLLKLFDDRGFIRVFTEDWVIKNRWIVYPDNTNIKNRKNFSVSYYKGKRLYYID